VDAIETKNLTDTELLAAALQDAMDAHSRGLVIGPPVDEVALARASRRALRRDTARALRTVGGAA
jgi:hypothetical protein